MSDHLRHSSSGQASPARSTPISRPTWPWQPSSLSSSSTSSSGSVDLRRTSVSLERTPSGMATTSTTPLPSTSNSRIRNAQQSGKHPAFKQYRQPYTREWSFMGFEWEVNSVHKLRDGIESDDPSRAVEYEEEDIQLLKLSPVIGDNKFKLEIAVTPTTGPEDAPTAPTLSLYITCLAVDNAHPDYELQATLMTAITCQADRNGERGAPPETVWSFWQADWSFRRDHEVWECPLPSLSSLLENERVRDTDSFVICVQIHCPVGTAFPQQPSAYSIPRDLLEGLEASLDNANTGDVRFICLERCVEDSDPPSSPQQGSGPPAAANPDLSRSLSQSTASSNPFQMHATVRKRVIYAHSDILTRRSEYFATMLGSSFSENPILAPGERKMYTVTVEDAEFETVFWLLKYCYVNWLLFREDDDPRIAMDSINPGWSSKWNKLPGGEWDWKTLQRDDGDTRSVTSGGGESVASGEGPGSEPAQGDAPGVQPSGSKTIATKPSNSSVPPSSRRVVTSPSQTLVSGGSKPTPRTKGQPLSVGSTSFLPSTRSGYSLSPRSGRQQSITSDPHSHPTNAPRPASALAMYRIAHRYAIPGLINLALEHMMTTLTPQSSFALLLATSVWEELHMLVEDYVVDKWNEVSVTEEFEQCCQEIAAGDWGSEGGKTLTSIFRRLRSPAASTR